MQWTTQIRREVKDLDNHISGKVKGGGVVASSQLWKVAVLLG